VNFRQNHYAVSLQRFAKLNTPRVASVNNSVAATLLLVLEPSVSYLCYNSYGNYHGVHKGISVAVKKSDIFVQE